MLIAIESSIGAVTLECPRCGNVGAIAGESLTFYDGQPLICGCDGQVSCDAETEPEIVNDD